MRAIVRRPAVGAALASRPGMELTSQQRGSTLVEAVVATALLATLAAGTASLLLLSHGLARQSEQVLAATALATSRLDALRAIPWHYSLDGAAPGVPSLDPSPADALERSQPGYSDAVDGSGSAVGPGAPESVFVRRWAIRSVMALTDTRAIEVCVFPGAAANNPPLACVVSVRTRQP
jgi:type II secretory pathway pseudopilin PulG